MKLFWLIPLVLVLDFIRSAIVIYRLNHDFHAAYVDQPELYALGKGKQLHIVLLGDSGIDGNMNNKIKFGPAQSLVEALAKKHKVVIHIYAKQGSKSYDVVEKQLPKLKQLPKVDALFIYMGANNVIRGQSPRRVRDDYETILRYAQKERIVVVASEIADYWQLSMFSVVHRLIIFICNKSANRQVRELKATYSNFVYVNLEWLTRKYLGKKYFADRLHPNDRLLRIWADKILVAAEKNPAVQQLL